MNTFQKIQVALASITLVFLFAGCSTLSGAECRNLDWYKKGKKDAVEGKPAETFSQYQEQCAAYDMTLSPEDYNRGHAEALPQYHQRMKAIFEAQSNCQADSDCNLNTSCSAGYCSGPGAGTGPVPCKNNSDCGPQRTCKSEERQFGIEKGVSRVCK